MRGHVVLAESISYHERHSIHPDSVVPERFGKPLEIPEDLVPVPSERPTALHAHHPMAKFVNVYETVLDEREAPRERLLQGHVEFVDRDAGVVVELFMDETLPAYAAMTPRARAGLSLRIEYDEKAIWEENDRRLKKAMEIAAYYARVIDLHIERVGMEQAEKASKTAEEQQIAQDNVRFKSEVTFPSPDAQGEQQSETQSEQGEGAEDLP